VRADLTAASFILLNAWLFDLLSRYLLAALQWAAHKKLERGNYQVTDF